MGANAASAATTGAKIAIVMGSKSDWATMQFAAEVLTQLEVPSMSKSFPPTVRRTSCSASPSRLPPTALT